MDADLTELHQMALHRTGQEPQFQTTISEKNEVPPGQRQASKAATNVDYLTKLNINSTASKVGFTGIVCTLGPVSQSPAMLLEMMENGMTVARLNCSHGNHEFHGKNIDNVRTAANMYKEKHGVDPCIAIALDTKGPEIRTGILEGDEGTKEVELKDGNSIKITIDDQYKEACTARLLWVDYKNITKVLEPGKLIYIDDGLISVKVTDIGQDFVNGVIVNGGNLGSRKGCNLPGTNTDLPAVSEKDKADLKFGVEKGVDVIFASFIRDAAGVKEIRKVLGKKGENIWIIPKIENQQGVDNIDGIIEESEAIMVARGDMGIEIPSEKVFIAQKQIIAKCNKVGKPVITSTQMLESMVKKPRCTRAEASDVANAVMDGTDCVMLSGETAKGKYPVVCVKTMAAIAKEAESCFWNHKFFEDLLKSEFNDGLAGKSSAVSSSAVLASHMCQASAIVVLAHSVENISQVSKYRPNCPILAATVVSQLARQMQFCRGVIPLLCQNMENTGLSKALVVGKQRKIISDGDSIVTITHGQHVQTISIAQV